MTDTMKRWLVMSVLGLALYWAAFMIGWVGIIIDGDSTGISYGVFAIAGVGLMSMSWTPEWGRWLCDHGVPLLLGLLGTLVGFMTALSGMVLDDSALKMQGVDSALTTTITGLVVHLYLLVTLKVVHKQ